MHQHSDTELNCVAAFALKTQPIVVVSDFLMGVRRCREERGQLPAQSSLGSMALMGVQGLAQMITDRAWVASGDVSPFEKVFVTRAVCKSDL